MPVLDGVAVMIISVEDTPLRLDIFYHDSQTEFRDDIICPPVLCLEKQETLELASLSQWFAAML